MNDKIDFDKTRMMRDSTILEMFAKQDLNFDLEWKRLNLIDSSIMDYMDNLDVEIYNDAPAMDHMDKMNVVNAINNEVNVLRAKIEIDVELGLQHNSDASRNMNIWSHGSDNLKLKDNVKLVNMDMIPLNEDDGLCMAMNSRYDTGLEPIQESPLILTNITCPFPLSNNF